MAEATIEDPFATQVDRAWNESFSFVRELAPPMGRFGADYLSSMPLFGRTSPVGDHLPFWLAESLGVVDDTTVNALGTATILGNAHIVIQDNIIDRQAHPDPQLVCLSNLLLARSLALFYSVVPSPAQFSSYVEHFLEQYSDAVLWENQHRGKVRKSFCAEDFTRVSWKGAPAKICVAAVALVAGEAGRIDRLSKAVDSFSLATQLLDDVRDWEEDIDNGIYSYPVTLAIRRLTPEINWSPRDKGPSKPNLKMGLFLSGVVERVLEESDSLARACEELVEDTEGRFVANYLALRKGRIDQGKRELVRMKVAALGQGSSPGEASLVEDQAIEDAQYRDKLFRLETWEALDRIELMKLANGTEATFARILGAAGLWI